MNVESRVEVGKALLDRTAQLVAAIREYRRQVARTFDTFAGDEARDMVRSAVKLIDREREIPEGWLP